MLFNTQCASPGHPHPPVVKKKVRPQNGNAAFQFAASGIRITDQRGPGACDESNDETFANTLKASGIVVIPGFVLKGPEENGNDNRVEESGHHAGFIVIVQHHWQNHALTQMEPGPRGWR